MINLDKNKIIAIVGASSNIEKYGYKIIENLISKNFKLYLINPKGGEILGLKVYKKLEDLPEQPDIINFVVPPKVTLQVLDEVKELGWDNVWFQPGSFDDNVIAKAKQLKLNFEADRCIMVAASLL